MILLKQEFSENIETTRIFFNEIIEEHHKVTHCTTLKSSMILMLYNISESTIRKIIEYLHDHLSSFDINQLSPELKNNFLKYKNGSKFPSFKFFIKNKRGSLFSGNVDSRKIRKELRKYGIHINLPYEAKYLLNIKYLRNKLAHGNMTFKEASRNITNEELSIWINAVKTIFLVIILEVENFINKKLYFSKVSSSAMI